MSINVDHRPRIRPGLATSDWAMEILAAIVLLMIWAFAVYAYDVLPKIIPTHFNGSGVPDAYGSKSTLFILPSIGVVLYIGITWLNTRPHIFNYLNPITPENALRQYTFATRLLRIIKLIVLVLFAAILWYTYRSAQGQQLSKGFFVPALVFIIVVPNLLVVIYLIKSFSKR
ncbi:MAG: DUF1648 domain-containing protein [Chitinophagaceae bacterium]|nr:MAG: DUF1648 domain-containing protein [Chitinophagaceae bacterium]